MSNLREDLSLKVWVVVVVDIAARSNILSLRIVKDIDDPDEYNTKQ
jgi:hypothetical protein